MLPTGLSLLDLGSELQVCISINQLRGARLSRSLHSLNLFTFSPHHRFAGALYPCPLSHPFLFFRFGIGLTSHFRLQ